MIDISTATGRRRLPKRQEPYWVSLGSRKALGYRTGTGAGRKATAETWIARYRELNRAKKHHCSLGQHPDFTAAKRAAEEWFARMDAGPRRHAKRGTVRDALAAYVRNLRAVGRRSAAFESARRFRLTVGRKSEFGSMRLEDVRRGDVEAWRHGLRKGRQPRSVNRQVRSVVAALNFAVKHGHVGNREAWALDHLRDEGEEGTPVFLTADQRERLIAAASPAFAPFLRGLSYTGCRPSELAQARVADFNADGRTLSLHHRKGHGARRRNRAVALPKEAVEFFREQCRGKLPGAPLITGIRAGEPWNADRWCHWMQRAVERANKTAQSPEQRIPAGATCYSFRHTRISELLQMLGVDPLTVAAQTGTSVGVIERHYFRFIKSTMLEKLDAAKAL